MKAKKLFFLILAISLHILSFNIILAQDSAITISIDASQELGAISPYDFGMNFTPGGVSLDMLEPAASAGITFFRWPGGNWGDLHDVTHQQVDLYMALARKWNVEPSIHVRLKDGSPEKAAELVHYTNIEKDYGVHYWYIGNEPNLFDGYTVEQLNKDWRAFALAMRAVDPTIILIGPEISQFPDAPDDYHTFLRDDWLKPFLMANGDLVDIVSVHRYPFPIDKTMPTTIDQMRGNVPRWNTLIDYLRADIRATVGHDMPIAITEANSHWSNSGGGIATPDSYYNAIWWSAVLTTILHQDVKIVAYWEFYSTGNDGQFGILDRYNPRPTYYTYQLFKDFGLTQLASESSDPYITVVAARRDDGTITAVITNLYEEDVSLQLDLQGLEGKSIQSARLLSPDIQAKSVDITNYFDGTTLTIPAQSAIRLDME